MATIKKVEKGPRIGKWRLRAGAGGKIDRYFDTKTEAQRWFNAHGTVKKPKASVWTLDQLFTWLKENSWPNRIEASTIKSRDGRYRIYVQTDWGQTRLDAVDPIEFQEWIAAVYKSGKVGDSTVVKIRNDLSQVWSEGVKLGKCSPLLANPFQATVRSPSPRIAVVLTPKEALKAYGKLTGDRRTLFALGIGGGLRIGEVLAFRSEQMFEGFLLINAALKKYPERIGLPKKDKVRQAVCGGFLKSALSQHEWKGEFCLKQERQDKNLTRKQAYKLFHELLEEGGLPQDFDTHDMRLNHINWIEKLAPEVSGTTLQEHIGHSSGGVTQTNYTRPLTLAQQSLADAIDRILEYTPPPSEDEE